MKKRGISIVLAVVLSLVMVLGSASVASAKGNPHRSMVFDISQYNGTNILIKVDLDFEGYRTYGWNVTWWQFTGGEWVYDSYYDWDYGELRKSGMAGLYKSGVVYPGEVWQARLYFVRKNGNVWKRESAWANYTVVAP